MHKTNSIIMRAPKMSIFETATNLELWPKILPHYRYIRYLERSPDRNVVVMAATRSGIPISWTSEQIIDREKIEMRFHHLKAFTKGMRVVWTFKETPEGVLVEIAHDLRFLHSPHCKQDVALYEGTCRSPSRTDDRMSRRRAVITGIGPITCIGHGREDFWNGILAKKSGINTITSFDPGAFRVRCAGEIRDWDPEKFFPAHRLKRLD